MDENDNHSTLHVRRPVVIMMHGCEDVMKFQEPPQLRMDCMTRGSETQSHVFCQRGGMHFPGWDCITAPPGWGVEQLSPVVRLSPVLRLSGLFEIKRSQPPLFRGLFEIRRFQPPLKSATQEQTDTLP